MGLSYYTTDGGRASDVGEFYTLDEAMEHYHGIQITKRNDKYKSYHIAYLGQGSYHAGRKV